MFFVFSPFSDNQTCFLFLLISLIVANFLMQINFFFHYQIMEEGKWEERNKDLLVEIFRRVGIESLFLDVPLVCKSWYKASLRPTCWEHLHFPNYIKPCCAWDYILAPYLGRILTEYGHLHYIHGFTQVGCPFSVSAIIKFVVNRSRRCATELSLSICCHERGLNYAYNQ